MRKVNVVENLVFIMKMADVNYLRSLTLYGLKNVRIAHLYESYAFTLINEAGVQI
jgi:hypothetical protein